MIHFGHIKESAACRSAARASRAAGRRNKVVRLDWLNYACELPALGQHLVESSSATGAACTTSALMGPVHHQHARNQYNTSAPPPRHTNNGSRHSRVGCVSHALLSCEGAGDGAPPQLLDARSVKQCKSTGAWSHAENVAHDNTTCKWSCTCLEQLMPSVMVCTIPAAGCPKGQASADVWHEHLVLDSMQRGHDGQGENACALTRGRH
eukprot:1161151-Pelagomonas_calceolata.AAC.11